MFSAPEKVLWFDDDPFWIHPYLDAIRGRGYHVDVSTTVSEAESFIKANLYRLLILDVIIPTKSEQEERLYPPHITKCGRETGLVFYRRMKETLEEAHTSVLVMTIRVDSQIRDMFIQEGLSPEDFATKLALRELPVFLAKVESILELNRYE